MAGILDFVLRPPEEVVGPAPSPSAAEAVAVLAPAALLDGAAHAVAAAAAGRGSWRGALICRWCAAGSPLPEPRHGARPVRAVQRLRRAGLDAVSWHGHVVVALPSLAASCLDAIEQACERTDAGPLIVAVGGPRPAELDPVIAAADAVIVACLPAADRRIAELALTRAASAGRRGGILALPAAGGLGAALAHGRARRAAAALLAAPAASCVVAGASGEAAHAH